MNDLTLVFAAYNDSPTLQELLRQLASQRCHFPLIIVDDCSTDDTGAMVQKLSAETDLSITYLRNEQNVGPGPSRNTGVENCQTRYFAFLDADDYIKPHFTHYMSKIAANDFDVAMIKYDISGNRNVKYTGHMHRVDNAVLGQFSDYPSPYITDREDIWSFCSTNAFPWNKVYAIEFYNRIGAHFPDRRLHEDILPHWQVLLNAETVFFDYAMPSLLTHFEVSDASRATNKVSVGRLEAYADLAKIVSMAQSMDSNVPVARLAGFVRSLDEWIMKDIPDDERIPARLRQMRLDLLTALKIRL